MNTYTQSELFTTNELMNVFVISDHHFYHENIIKYCNRPFNSLREMNYTMIEKWNSVVSENDTVLHLGDFSFGDKRIVSRVRKHLNGKIYMVKGNHDKHGVSWYNNVGITMFKKPFMIDNFLFSHAKKTDIKPDVIGIHGHSHNHLPLLTENKWKNKWYNVSVENLDYTPIKIKDLLNGKV